MTSLQPGSGCTIQQIPFVKKKKKNVLSVTLLNAFAFLAASFFSCAFILPPAAVFIQRVTDNPPFPSEPSFTGMSEHL